MLKCSNIPKYQNISKWVKCPNTPKSKYVPVGKIHSSGQNVLITPILYTTYSEFHLYSLYKRSSTKGKYSFIFLLTA